MVLLVSGVAVAAGTLDVVRQRGVLVVGVKADFPPFGFVDERGQLQGFASTFEVYGAATLLYLGMVLALAWALRGVEARTLANLRPRGR